MHTVLQVDGEAVPSGMGHDFGGERIGNGEPAIDDSPTLAPHRPQIVLAQDTPSHSFDAKSSSSVRATEPRSLGHVAAGIAIA